jgi:hypothetical protein
MSATKPVFKKGQAVTVIGTKHDATRRAGKFVAEHPSTRGSFYEVQLDGGNATAKFRASQVDAA